MNKTELQMPRHDVEAIAFWLVSYNRWKAAPLSLEAPARYIESIPFDRAQQLFRGNQLEMAMPHSKVQKLFEFFAPIDDSERWYFLSGFLKHPDFQPRRPTFFGMFIDGPGLSNRELDLFSKQFKASVDTLQNKTDDSSYDGSSFYASWGFPEWLPDEMRDQLDSGGIPARIPDKSYIKWRGKDLPRLD